MDNSKLDTIFANLRTYLDEMDSIREKLLSIQRDCIRICSQIIKSVHRSDLNGIESKISEAQNKFSEMQTLLNDAPGDMPKDYISIAAQELGEAVIFYELIIHDTFPTSEKIGITTYAYAYALSDVIGELRRYILKTIRDEEIKEAFRLFDVMNEIYSNLFTLDYPNGLIPGLRRKIDVARGILSKTEGDLTISSSLIRFNKNFKKEKVE